MSEISRKV